MIAVNIIPLSFSLTYCPGDTNHFLTGSADNTAIIWDTETGKKLAEIVTQSAVRTCNFSYSGKEFMLSTDAALGKACQIQVFDLHQCLSEFYINIGKNARTMFENFPMFTFYL